MRDEQPQERNFDAGSCWQDVCISFLTTSAFHLLRSSFSVDNHKLSCRLGRFPQLRGGFFKVRVALQHNSQAVKFL